MSMPSTYGLNGAVRQPAAQPRTLLGMGMDQQRAGMSALNAAAAAESRRNIMNQQLEQESKAGYAQLGSTLGAVGGYMASGPWGGMLGGALGGIIGGHF